MSDQTTTPNGPQMSERQISPYSSPVLQALEAKYRPQPSPACETCPLSMWFTTQTVLKCYCKQMHAVVWDLSNELVTPIMDCDGREIAIAALLDAANS